MNYCKMSIPLAYIASVYILASVFYLCYTKNIGTPFKDAYTKYSELVKIKEKSKNQRLKIFYMGIASSIALLCIIQPFKRCN